MSINLDKIKQRLNSMNEKNTTRSALWKPKGKSVVRIVPYAFNKEYPFIELYFHYGFGGKTYLSPSSYGRPDPIVECADKLKKTGSKEDYKQARAIEPKMRVYVPVVVRGEESEGVKFWGFGKQVYQELLGIMNDPDYGDITDLKQGRDITVEFKTKEETGKDFPETSVRAKPNATPVCDPTDKSVIEKIKNQKNISDVFPEPSYDDLCQALDKWLNSGSETDSDSSESSTIEEEVVTESVTAKEKKPLSKNDLDSQFDELFNG